MSDERKNTNTIQRHCRQLRKLTEQNLSSDPIVARIAQAMETALRWSSERVVGWPSMKKEAQIMADILKEDLSKSK